MKNLGKIFMIGLIFVLCLSLTGCSGLIPPRIGESGVADNQAATDTQEAAAPAQEEGQAAEGDSAGEQGGEGEGESAGDQGEGESGGSEGGSEGGSGGEPATAPEMTGNVVYRFYHEEMKSTSLGGMEQFTAEALLYDEKNADGINGVIHLTSGSSESYMTCDWTENEDGTLSLQTDEFNIFEAKEVEGVLTIVGIRYSLGMMNSGTVDIPLAQ